MRKPSTVNRRRKRQFWITVAVILSFCCLGASAVALIAAAGIWRTPTPALETNNTASQGTIVALISYTQTADAQIPITGPTDTATSPSDEASAVSAANTHTEMATAAPSEAFTPTITNTPVPTSTPLPTRTAIPTFTPVPALPTLDPLQGVTAICNDGSYSYSQHRQGTCSHHGGVKEWINRPPS